MYHPHPAHQVSPCDALAITNLRTLPWSVAGSKIQRQTEVLPEEDSSSSEDDEDEDGPGASSLC